MLCWTSGAELTESGKIWKRAAWFYTDLFSSESEENKDMFEYFCRDLPKVPEDFRTEMGAPFVPQELYTALLGMEREKAPGIDGIPAELYKEFWEVLGEDLLTDFNSSFKDYHLPQS